MVACIIRLILSLTIFGVFVSIAKVLAVRRARRNTPVRELADPFSSSVRMMNYVLQGDTLIRNLSIVDKAGGANIALVKDMWAMASGGNGLTLFCFGASSSDVFEGGIEIDGVSSGSTRVQGSSLKPHHGLFSIVSARAGRVAVRIDSQGPFTARMLSPNGVTLASMTGIGPTIAEFSAPKISYGMVILEFQAGEMRARKPHVIK